MVARKRLSVHFECEDYVALASSIPNTVPQFSMTHATRTWPLCVCVWKKKYPGIDGLGHRNGYAVGLHHVAVQALEMHVLQIWATR